MKSNKCNYGIYSPLIEKRERESYWWTFSKQYQVPKIAIHEWSHSSFFFFTNVVLVVDWRARLSAVSKSSALAGSMTFLFFWIGFNDLHGGGLGETANPPIHKAVHADKKHDSSPLTQNEAFVCELLNVRLQRVHKALHVLQRLWIYELRFRPST